MTRDVALWCHSCADLWVLKVTMKPVVRGRGRLINNPETGVCEQVRRPERADIREECDRVLRLTRCPICRRRLRPAPEQVVVVG